MSSYLVPAAPIRVEQVVKRSQFICYIAHCPTRADAETFIRRINEQHPDANHNCWACVAGNPGDPAGYGMSDDGEPRGCAGKPMFNVLHHSGIGEICAVVSRYFGGIKLGTGGMARAYSSSVQLAINDLETTVKIHYVRVTLTLPYALLKTTEHLIAEVQGKIVHSDYSAEVQMIADIPENMAEIFLEKVCEASQGTIIYRKK